MIKRGFTLAEVLLTLGIIGVVAAITLPSLNLNITKQQVGTQLMKAINTLENAHENILADKQTYSFKDACRSVDSDWLGCYVKLVAPYIRGSLVNFSDALGAGADQNSQGWYGANVYTGFDDFNLGKFLNNNTKVLQTKDGITFLPINMFNYGPAGAETEYLYAIIIDVNGQTNPPNQIGKDAFLAYVSETDGQVYLHGSKMFIELIKRAGDPERYTTGSGSNQVSVENKNLRSWKDYCNATEVKDVTTCGGSIVDNNGKVIYDLQNL